VANLLSLDTEEWVTTDLTVREFTDDHYFLFVTRRGMIKRSAASLYARCRKTGMIAVGLRDDDELIAVREVNETCNIVLTTRHGLAIRFRGNEARPMGRGAAGVKGIALRGDDAVVACVVVTEGLDPEIMTVSRNGYGKRTKLELYRVQSRGGKGIINFKVTPKTGDVIGAMTVADNDALILLTSTNKIIRIAVDDVRSVGRATQGVRLVSLDGEAFVVGFDRIDETNGDNGSGQE
jgi:DNA gyrase subunit A